MHIFELALLFYAGEEATFSDFAQAYRLASANGNPK